MTEADLTAPAPRHRSPVFELADRYVERLAELDPCAATGIGISAHDDRLTDYSPTALRERADLARETLAGLAGLPVYDDADRVAAEVIRERLGALLLAADAGDDLRDLNVLACPLQGIRQVFDLAPTHDAQARDNVLQRLRAVPAALESWLVALQEGLAEGLPAARRQAVAVATQAETFAGRKPGRGWFSTYAAGLEADSDAAGRELGAAGLAADRAYAEAGAWLRDVYAPQADTRDGVRRERYARFARAWNGADLDLDGTWDWGWAELERITELMRVTAEAIEPGAAPADAKALLDREDRYQIEGTGPLLEFLTGLTAEATASMDGTWFDIDPRIRDCEVRLAPEGSAAAPYYVPVSEDLSRPGSTWYPTRGRTRFPRWWLVSVWYHESVPGHHLQFGTAAVERERLSRFQRTFGFTSGYGEGWALYAERLMDELGFLADPSVQLGYLSAQAMRAARVVLDIGLHLGLTFPPGQGDLSGTRFDAASAAAFLSERALLDADFAASEIDRYLGIPGQAISYKVGERVWLAARDEARARLGDAFDLKDWHMHALRLGPMGLDPFATEMASYVGSGDGR
ncbi:MAG: DUF885 domain-containing protein [Candidatus Nanopelagicales bacterium]